MPSANPLTDLRLGIIPTIAPYILPKVLNEIKTAYPSTSIYVRETITQKLVEDLINARLDMAILALPLEEPRLETQALFDEELVLVSPANRAPLAQPSLDVLKDMRLLLLEEGNCLRDNAMTFCEANSLTHNGVLDGSTLATLTQLVQEGMGVTLLPAMAVKVETQNLDVCVSRFADPPPYRTIGVAWRVRSPLSQTYRDLVKHLSNLAFDRLDRSKAG